MKILIAEDDLISRNFLSKFLSKYGECDMVVDGLETIDAFLMALKDKDPYQLICLDIMMPKVDGVKALKAIRDLEKQHGVPSEKRVKIIMTTALAEAQLVRTAFDYGCEAYAAKPIDTQKFIEVMGKLGLIKPAERTAKPATDRAPVAKDNPTAPTRKRRTTVGQKEGPGTAEAKDDEKGKNTTKRGMPKDNSVPTMINKADHAESGYFKSVRALPHHQLEVDMETGTAIRFDFCTRLNTARFGMLRDEELFQSVYTDGNYLIFNKIGMMPVKITASEFMDLVLIDRTK